MFTVKNLKTYTDSQPIIIWSVVEVSLAVRFFPPLYKMYRTGWYQRVGTE